MSTRTLLTTMVLTAILFRPDVGFAQQAMVFDDPRVGLEAGLFDAEEAIWNLNMVATVPPSENFIGVTNSDLAFKGKLCFPGQL